jgi:hypothetical protein
MTTQKGEGVGESRRSGAARGSSQDLAAGLHLSRKPVPMTERGILPDAERSDQMREGEILLFPIRIRYYVFHTNDRYRPILPVIYSYNTCYAT